MTAEDDLSALLGYAFEEIKTGEPLSPEQEEHLCNRFEALSNNEQNDLLTWTVHIYHESLFNSSDLPLCSVDVYPNYTGCQLHRLVKQCLCDTGHGNYTCGDLIELRLLPDQPDALACTEGERVQLDKTLSEQGLGDQQGLSLHLSRCVSHKRKRDPDSHDAAEWEKMWDAYVGMCKLAGHINLQTCLLPPGTWVQLTGEHEASGEKGTVVSISADGRTVSVFVRGFKNADHVYPLPLASVKVIEGGFLDIPCPDEFSPPSWEKMARASDLLLIKTHQFWNNVGYVVGDIVQAMCPGTKVEVHPTSKEPGYEKAIVLAFHISGSSKGMYRVWVPGSADGAASICDVDASRVDDLW